MDRNASSRAALAIPSKPPRARDQRADLVVGIGLAVIAAGVTSRSLHAYGLDWADQFRLVSATVVTVLGPGLLVAHRFPAGSLPSRLGVALVAGIPPQLLGWFVAVRSGQSWLLWVSPLSAALAWHAVDRAVGDRLIGCPGETATVESGLREPVPWWASMAMFGSWLLILRSITRGVWSVTPLDQGLHWYPDLYWHVAITADSMQCVPPIDPQSMLDGRLDYHWFSNAHTAALTVSSGVALDKVSILFWYVPIAAAGLALVYGCATWLSRDAAGGALAVVLLGLPPVTSVVQGIDSGAYTAWVWFSPSHLFSVPIALLVTWSVIRLLQPPVTVSTVSFAGVLILLCPGTKVSLLPTILGGVAMVGLRALWQRRGVATPLLVGIGGAFVVLLTAPLFAGGGSGSTLSIEATSSQLRLWSATAEAHGKPSGLVLCLTVIALIGTYLYTVVVTTTFDEHDNPAPMMYVGMVALAFGAMFLIKHPSSSQVYFMRGIVAVSAVFTGWGLVTLFRRSERRMGRAAAMALAPGAVAIGLVVGLGWMGGPWYTQRVLRLRWLLPLGAAVAVVAAGIVLGLRGSRRCARTAATAGAFLILGFSLAASSRTIAGHSSIVGYAPASDFSPVLTRAEVAGAGILAAANPDGDLIATNVHCLWGWTTPHCDARGFWVAALTRSPVYIGGWSYGAHARSTRGNPYHVPYFDAAALELNQDVFAAPTRSDVARLRASGVRFLYADSRDSRVSPQLGRFAHPIWRSAGVTVYKMS